MGLCSQGLERMIPVGTSELPARCTNNRSRLSHSVKSSHYCFPSQSCLHPIMDHIVPTPRKRLNCGISITPQEMLYVQQAAQIREKASTPCSLGLQLPGLKRFVHCKNPALYAFVTLLFPLEG